MDHKTTVFYIITVTCGSLFSFLWKTTGIWLAHSLMLLLNKSAIYCQPAFNFVVNSLAVCFCSVHKAGLWVACDTSTVMVNIQMYKYSHNMPSGIDIIRHFDTDLFIYNNFLANKGLFTLTTWHGTSMYWQWHGNFVASSHHPPSIHHWQHR
jgi:hypothetical protein